ncbi:MAG: DEAD/DEAH box helicase [Verrucomicrobia bacterium]|nr:MAG: DEAD/DEAH box helicase [Verrucomicrobiota bacterium]
MPFRSLGLNAAILQAVQETGYTEPTPIQSAAIPLVLLRRDLIGIAQTGTGKTAAFTLPILSILAEAPAPGIRALVIAPTRELVVQIEENVRAYAKHLQLSMATIYGGVSEKPQIKALEHGVDIVIATPGRLLDIIRGREKSFAGIEFLVLDEADRMLDMGFVPAIRQIVKLLPRKRQTLFFSATLSREIEKLTGEFLQEPETVEIGRRSNPADTVSQSVYEIPQHLKPGMLLHLLQDPKFNMVLVFTRTKHGADRIARRLEQAKITSATIHSNRSQNQRLRALNEFREGKIRVLVATDIAARGIDVDGISHVVNYDFPPHHEDYVHRIGRTGRAKAVGEAVSFVSREDDDALRALERFTRRGIPRVKAEGFDYTAPAPPRDPNGGRRPPRRPGEVRTPRPNFQRGNRQERSAEGTQSKDRGDGKSEVSQGGHRQSRSRGRSDGKPRNIAMNGEPGKTAGGPAKKGGIGRFLGFGRR